ncbi:hypothetical protein V6U78_07280 [Marinospirillum sp. MEB164]|uniref:Bacteriophage replication gene A protein (GPA) n=1 Tax=Marinospirillum alkalitolerans TaxID=3123374 RepID=A0ABW8PX03_9GAMM
MKQAKSITLKPDAARLFNTKKVDKKCVAAVRKQNRLMLDAAKAKAQLQKLFLGVDPVYSTGNPPLSSENRFQQQNTKAPAWRFISTANAVFMNHYAMKKMETEHLKSMPFTFNITSGLLEKASASKKPLSSYLLKRLREALQRELRREVDFYFVIEVSGEYRNKTPHLHGEILLTRREIDLTHTNLRHPDERPVHAAFHSINDYSDNNLKNSAFMLKQVPTDAGWPNYLTKELGFTRLYTGNPVAETLRVTRTAKDIYREHFNAAGLKNTNNLVNSEPPII